MAFRPWRLLIPAPAIEKLDAETMFQEEEEEEEEEEDVEAEEEETQASDPDLGEEEHLREAMAHALRPRF